MEWITGNRSTFVSMMIDPGQAKEPGSRDEIERTRNKLLIGTLMRTLLDRARKAWVNGS